MIPMNHQKILPPTWLLISLVGMLGIHFLLPALRVIPLPWNLLGLLPLVGGIFIALVAERAFLAARTTLSPDRKPSTLVTKGPFRISRNPMYLGFLLVLIGTAVLLGNALQFLIALAFLVWMERQFILKEERALENEFGQAWIEYRGRVRRWI
jgi:protein-S-isoprenylcysteine O-methyltransferase Ste14